MTRLTDDDASHSSPTTAAGGAEITIDVPSDLLAGHPAAAYFWGHVAGSGEVTDGEIIVTTTDEDAAAVLATIASVDPQRIEADTTTRQYAHDTSITRTEDEYVVSITGDELFGRSDTLGLPVDGRGNYRFRALSTYDRELLRGLLEGCGTICFKSSSGTVGISFVHDDEALLSSIRDLIAACPIDAPMGDLSETSSGGYWFGVEDGVVPAFGTWIYEGCDEDEIGLFAPTRRRKLVRSLEQADAYSTSDANDLDGDPNVDQDQTERTR